MSILKGLVTAVKGTGIAIDTFSAGIGGALVTAGAAAVIIHCTGNDPTREVQWTEKGGFLNMKKTTYRGTENLVTSKITNVRKIK